MNHYIIAYDISDPRRLQRVHRILKRQAFAIGYSVFMYEGTQAVMHACLDEIRKVIDKKQDDVRCYPLPKSGIKKRMGKAILPTGITCTSLPTAFMVL